MLLSELMLQQTQVATVVPYFRRFLERFSTIERLAAADEQDVLRAWQGLGYYSRARNLHRAAKQVVSERAGRIPGTVDELLQLPGIGRYTAGAVASIAFGERAALVDGNVQRVLCRLDAIMTDPRERTTHQRLWRRAEELLPEDHVGDYNSALMELGAVCCTPRTPQCLLCPVRGHCEAAERGLTQAIPPVRKAIQRPVERRWVFCVEHDGRWLIEQRPAAGRWASMWQFVTVPQEADEPAGEVASRACGVTVGELRPLTRVSHTLTHRQYEFAAYAGNAKAKRDAPGRAWATMEGLGAYPLPRPHVILTRMLAGEP